MCGYRSAPLSLTDYFPLFNIYREYIAQEHTHTRELIRLAPQIYLYTHSLSHPDLMPELTVVRLISAESYTIGCLLTLTLVA